MELYHRAPCAAVTGLDSALRELVFLRPLSQTIALVTAFIGLLALAGYLYGVASLYDVFAFSSGALHSALTLHIASLGILLAHSEYGPMAILTTERSGGMLAWRLLPVVILFSSVFGWLRLKGQEPACIARSLGSCCSPWQTLWCFPVSFGGMRLC